MSTGHRCLVLMLGAAFGLGLWAGGCSERTPYPGALNSPRPDERARAAIRAAETGDRDVIGILVDRLEDPDEGVRFYAILALERLTGTRMGYDYRVGWSQRRRAVQEWRRYLAEQVKVGTGRAGGEGG